MYHTNVMKFKFGNFNSRVSVGNCGISSEVHFILITGLLRKAAFSFGKIEVPFDGMYLLVYKIFVYSVG